MEHVSSIIMEYYYDHFTLNICNILLQYIARIARVKFPKCINIRSRLIISWRKQASPPESEVSIAPHPTLLLLCNNPDRSISRIELAKNKKSKKSAKKSTAYSSFGQCCSNIPSFYQALSLAKSR